tara:strand:- start:1147 stop:1458 length:312 start_codon:yes stop_codon:yes gene_type:complete
MNWKNILKSNAYDGVRAFINENDYEFFGEGWDYNTMRGQLFKEYLVRGKENRQMYSKQLKLYLNELLGENVLSKDGEKWKKVKSQSNSSRMNSSRMMNRPMEK